MSVHRPEAGEEARPLVEEGSPTVRRLRLAAELRSLREAKGRQRRDGGARNLRWSPSKISRYERAKTGLRPREVERLLDYYAVKGAHRADAARARPGRLAEGLVGGVRRQPCPRTTSSSSALSTRRRRSRSGTWTWSPGCCRPRATRGTSSTATTGSSRSRRPRSPGWSGSGCAASRCSTGSGLKISRRARRVGAAPPDRLRRW